MKWLTFWDRFTADECLAHPWLRRKIPPPPPSLDNSKENLKVYVDKNVQNIKKSILIESDLKENPGVIEKLIDSQQKISYPHLISKPTSEFSLLTNAKFQEFLDHSKDSTQFLKPSNPNPKFNENISSKDRDEIISIKNIPEINNKSNNSYIYPLVSTPNQFNQNKNTSIKKDAKTCFGDRKDNPINNSNVANQSTAIRGVIFENDSLKKTTLSNENIGKTHSKSNTLQRDSEMSVGMFETKPQIADELKSKVEPNKSGLIPKIVGSTLNEPEQGSSYMNSNQLTRLEESAKNKKITEETIVSHSFTKRQEENTWFDSSAKVLPTQIGKDNIQITLNDYKPEESARMFDLSKVSDFIRRSSIKLTEQEKTFNKTCEAFKDVTTTGETPSFKQHLRSTPPWFSELNNMHLKKPMLDRFERRSSDFSCFLNSKEDSISLNLADEIRKLSARLLQMSNTQNEPVDKYTLNPSARSDPISCFLENHGISHPRPKYKFSNLNRDVPIGSPPPPSNIAYYLNMQSNVNKKDSHSAPGSPRLSPDRGRMNTNKGVPTNIDQSSMGLDAEPKVEKETITLPSQYTSERNDIKMAAVQTKSEPLKNKQSKSKHQVP